MKTLNSQIVTNSLLAFSAPESEQLSLSLVPSEGFNFAQRRKGAKEEIREVNYFTYSDLQKKIDFQWQFSFKELTVIPAVQLVDFSESKPSVEVPQEDPLVDRGAENLVYIGVGLLAITIVIVIGLFSRKVEYALVFAAILSIGLIGLLLLL